MNPIDYLVKKGFKITSDPGKYKSGIWGKRDYTVNGYNYDKYCGGYHRAYDLSKHDGAEIPAVCSGIVAAGTSSYGNFGGTVVIADKALGIQVIYGHLKRKLPVKIGQAVKQGDVIGYQSGTNYDNVPMASHLHIQFQKYGFIKGEKNFVCTGINPLKINVEEKQYPDKIRLKGDFIPRYKINVRDYPGLTGSKKRTVNTGNKVTFDGVYENDNYWWIRVVNGKEILFMAVGRKKSGVELLETELWGDFRNLNTGK